MLEGRGAPAGAVVVFGHAFVQGDVPGGEALAARLPDGRLLALQVDVTTRHADGSARMAIISLASPDLRAGERIGVMLSRRGAADTAAPFDVMQAAAGRAASVEVIPANGGLPWRLDLLTRLLDTLLLSRTREIWQRGPLAGQARIAAEIPASAVGGVRSARLVADLALRADGSLWSDVWVRNDIAMRPGGGTAAYSLRLVQDGREFVLADQVRQFQYTGFGRLTGTLPAGRAPQEPTVHHDIGYLADAAAIARYDTSTGVDERLLSGMANAMRQPDWNTPFSARGITREMGSSGGRADIGPTTAWQAAWLVSGDRRAAEFSLGQAEADGAIPWHFWDAAGGSDGRGGWMDTARWPRFWTDRRGGQPPFTLLQPLAENTGWSYTQSHQPDLSYVPYLLTGRRSFLDGVQSQGVMGILTHWPHVRADPEAPASMRDVLVVNGNQVRSAAWSLRQLDNAGWISPDDDPNSRFLRAALATNWAWVRRQLLAWTAKQGEFHGWIPGEYRGGEYLLPPWQQDFFASSASASARRGSEDALAVLAWMSNFLVGRFRAGDKGFSPRDGISAQLLIGPHGATTTDLRFRTWSAIGEAMRAADMANGEGWRHSNGYYGSLGLQTLAAIIDVLDDPLARRAWTWLVAAAPPYTSPEAFARDPTYSIIPRGGERVPDRALRCEFGSDQRRRAP